MKLIKLVFLNLLICGLQYRTMAADEEGGFEIIPSSKWKAVDTSDMGIQPGSALDMSSLVNHQPAGRYGRVIINSEGKLEFASRPGKAIRFFCCDLNMRCILEYRFKEKKDTEKLAEMIRLQGYNMVRLVGVADYLVHLSGKDQEFSPVALEQLDWLIYNLKKNGIYVYLDIVSFYRAFHKYTAYTGKEKYKLHIKWRMLFDEAARQHWFRGFSKLMLHKNRYTGLKIAEDPVIAVVLFYNEQGIRLKAGENLAYFLPAWRRWLKGKYKTISALKKARAVKAAGFDDVPMFSIHQLEKAPPSLQKDIALFMMDVHNELYQWYLRKAREIGYKGIVTQYDWLHKLINQVIRSKVEAVSMHGYHSHPEYRKKISVPQTSSISAGGKYFCEIAGTRYNGKPFMVTEYGDVFWNKYRYEEGLLFGAYASLQDFDLLGVYSHPVADKVKRFIYCDPKVDCIFPFQVGSDPVGRASQVVTGFAFARGDIATAKNSINVVLSEADVIKRDNSIRALDINQMRLALVSKIGISYSKQIANKKSFVNVRPEKFTKVDEKKWVAHVNDSEKSTKSVDDWIKVLKNKNNLQAGNKTCAGDGTYQSDTGQIFLVGKNNFLAAISPTFEGACIDVSLVKEPVRLGNVTIKRISVSGSICVIALDNKKLAESKRVLIVYATDALNSGMSFVSDKRTTLVDYGHLPVLMRTGGFDIELQNRNAVAGLWALGLNGKRKDKLTFRQDGESLNIEVDTSKLPSGPTPFFEIEFK